MNTEASISIGLPAAAIAALHEGKKIQAIKIVRIEARVGLKEAKERVEAYLEQNPALQDAADSQSGGGAMGWLFMLAVALAAIVYFWPD